MKNKQIAPYGTWKSPITAEDVFARFIGIGGIQLVQEDIYWGETRPDGRTVIVQRTPDGATRDITPAAFNVRTRVHEYGGGDYLVSEGTIHFSNFTDQKTYRQAPDSEPQPVTRSEGRRHADYIMDPRRRRLIAVCEDHTVKNAQPANSLVAIDLEGDGENERTLVEGSDFYSSPRLSPDGSRLAWLTWNHPNMPWDGTELRTAEVLSDGSLGSHTLVAGGADESIFQPEWSPDGGLYFVSDRSGWWNLYRWCDGKVKALHPMQAEFGEPQWVFGISTYAFEPAGRLVCAYSQNGCYSLALLDTGSLAFKNVKIPYTSIFEVHAQAGHALLLAGSATEPLSLVRVDLENGRTEVLKRVREISIDPGYFSAGRDIEFPTAGGLTAHGIFYPPTSRDFCGPPAGKPPLLVMSHGGPTGFSSDILRYGIQYWTTRGFAVLDVNYGGSTGYGRAYRERLKGQWGIVDVADCVNGARHLAGQGMVDGERLAITGGSAGGFTTLCALTFHDTFSTGASYFGVSDLETLARDTHKFESRYLDGLVGPYPERRDLYLARSPIHHVNELNRPMIILQGLDDPVVPPNQAQLMYEAVRSRELPVAYLTFPGEQHGFLKAENNKRALEAELYFYSRIFKFEPAQEIEPVPIENL